MARGINTRCLHLEELEGKTENYGAISYPIYQTATYAHPGVGQSTGYDYSILSLKLIFTEEVQGYLITYAVKIIMR